MKKWLGTGMSSIHFQDNGRYFVFVILLSCEPRFIILFTFLLLCIIHLDKIIDVGNECEMGYFTSLDGIHLSSRAVGYEFHRKISNSSSHKSSKFLQFLHAKISFFVKILFSDNGLARGGYLASVEACFFLVNLHYSTT